MLKRGQRRVLGKGGGEWGVTALGQSWGMEELHLHGRAEGVQTRQGGLDQGRTARGGREGAAPRSPWLPTSLHLRYIPFAKGRVAFEGRGFHEDFWVVAEWGWARELEEK